MLHAPHLHQYFGASCLCLTSCAGGGAHGTEIASFALPLAKCQREAGEGRELHGTAGQKQDVFCMM